MAGRAAQRRRLAVLALLALAPRRALTRERVIGYLWPDHPPDAARRLLSEAVYVLRRELGDEVITSVGDEIALGAALGCDVDQFARAVAVGDREAALAFYAGPLLDGWFVRDAPDFERWVEGERTRIARLHAQTVRELAEAREAAGDWPGAAALWQTLTRADPYSATIAWHAARALAAAGERAAALQALASHETLLQNDLGVGLDAELTALAARIRSGAEGRAAPIAAAGAAGPPAPAAVSPPAAGPASEPVTLPQPVAAAPAPPAPVAPPARARRRPAQAWIAGAAMVAALGGFGAYERLYGGPAVAGPAAGSARAGRALDAHRVAVLYFDDRSPDRRLEYLADGLTEGLIRELTSIPPVRVLSEDAVRPFRGRAVPVDSLAAALGAGTVVSASVREDGGRVRVAVRVIDGRTGDQVAVDTLSRPRGELAALADDLAARVAGMLRPRLGEQLRAAARRDDAPRGRSNEALDLVFRADRLRRATRATRLAPGSAPLDPQAARDSLGAADSLLALAQAADPGWPRPAVERGWVAVAAGRLEHGTARVVALSAGLAHAERALTLQQLRAPTDSATLARVLYLRGALRVRTATAVQTFRPELPTLRAGAGDLRAAVAIDPTLAGAWATLALAEHAGGEFARAQAAATRALEADAYLAEAPDVIGWAWRSASSLGDRAAAERWCARGRQLVPDDWHFVECELTLMRADAAGLTGRRPDPARARALVAELERIDPERIARAAGHPYSPHYRRLVMAAVLAAAGERDGARAVLARTLAAVQGDPELATDVLYDAAFLRFVLRDGAAAERDLAAYVRARPDLADFLARDRTLAAARAGPRAGSSAGAR